MHAVAGSPKPSHSARVFFVAMAASLAGLLLLPSIPQDQDYHQFADSRAMLGIPNFWNVVSNIPFIAVGAAGLWRFRGDPASFVLFVGFFLTGIGSSYYHWDPNDGTLFWDRLPMTLAFAAVLALAIQERVSARTGAVLLWPLLAIGLLSLLLWRWVDDLRLYLWAQFFPFLALALLFLLYPAKYTGTSYWLVAAALYALAKLFEFFDRAIYSVGNLVSGHTLKHLAAAAACFVILRYFRSRRPVLILALFASLLSGCSEDGVLSRFMLKPANIIVERRPDPAYDQLFPYYVELCATSQFRSKFKGEGGVAGHATMYIKGACKDEQAPYPQLRRCRSAATDRYDPEHGAGISVGRWFRNVNWVAVPGYALFFEGNLKAGEPLTKDRFDATMQDAIAKGVYKGVEFHDYPTADQGTGLENFVATEGVGTDFALQFARSVFCARIPVTEPMVDEVIAFLNDKNREYAEGDADYNWSVWADNCSHTLRNALAAANIWSPLSVRAVKFRQIFNLALPANEFVNLAELGTEGNIADYRQIQRDGPQRDAFYEFGWLPTRQGAMLKTLPVHEPNELYDTTFRLFTLQSPFTMGKTQHAIDLLSDERFVDLGANLRYFRDQYDAILAGRDQQRDSLASVRGTPYRRIERLHYQYIERQRAEVDSMLARLPELEKSTASTLTQGTAPR